MKSSTIVSTNLQLKMTIKSLAIHDLNNHPPPSLHVHVNQKTPTNCLEIVLNQEKQAKIAQEVLQNGWEWLDDEKAP